MTELNREVLVIKYGKENFINLTYIELSESEIRNIDFNTFKDLAKLKILDLSYNDINKINLNTTKLNYLDVSNNKNLSNVVDFNPNSIKIIKQKNISVDKPLVFSLSTIKPLH